MKQFKVLDYDIIYLSYDEPNAEENYTNLLTKVPWAKRIHGVEGSDAAHKACAEISDTKRFITIDGDNQIDEQFLNQTINFQEGVDLSRHVVSWTADNIINGLRYGNGGIKCWDRETVLKMKTHENADPDNIAAGIDFCWDLEYIQINSLMSTVHNNATPHQAWRAGFREGVKMCLVEGIKPAKKELIGNHWKNLERLYVWCMAGADVPNGLWAIYGAREGLHKTMCTDWDYVNVRDFEYLNNLWKEKIQTEDDLLDACIDYGERILAEIELPIAITPLDAQQSAFFKKTYRNPPRPEHPYIRTNTTQFNTFSSNFIATKKTEYDIVMISYDEANADENFNKLKTRFPRAQRIHGVKGIHQAHIAAANLCSTEMFWIVDGDAIIDDNFNFDYVAEDNRAVHVWRSKNPINDLVYGYGGVKLFPTQMTRDMDTSRPDMTTSISDRFKKMEKISCITGFNTSEFSTWRSAFRECAKLASKVIDRQKEDETNERLKTWTTVGHDRPFGEYALAGATAGMEFGLSGGSDLRLINDFEWLKKQFDIAYPEEIFVESKSKSQEIVDLLDRFEYMYDGLSDVRRLYNDNDLSSVFKIADNEELRKAVVEKNLHSIFRLVNASEDLRKAILEKNLHSIFRVTSADVDLRKAVMEENFYSMARLLPEAADEFKLLQHDKNALWRVLEKYTNSLFVPALKKLQESNIDMDCFSRGQIQSKKWLVDKLKELDLNLGTVFICAGWYATIIPMCSEADIKFDKIRSFDIDDSVWKIAETFNQHLKDNWKFKAQTKDIMDINYTVDVYTTVKGNGDIEECKDSPDTIVNTSCEHIEKFDEWFAKIPKGKLVILQSNNFFEVEEHVNCVNDSLHFEQMAPLSEVYFAGELPLDQYTRYMRIGRK